MCIDLHDFGFFMEGADEWGPEIWKMIRERSDLHFAIITKRIHRFQVGLPEDWGEGYEIEQVTCDGESGPEARICDYAWILDTM